MTTAEAMTHEDPRLGELISLLDWPWKLAFGLLLAAPLPVLLAQAGWLVLPWPTGGTWLALALAGGGALLALAAGLRTLRGLLTVSEARAPAAFAPGASATGFSPAPAPATSQAEVSQTIAGLCGLLDEQRRHTHEAAAAVSRAVSTGAQLAGIARALEQRLKDTLALAPSQQGEAPDTGRLEALLQRLEAALPVGPLAALPPSAADLPTPDLVTPELVTPGLAILAAELRGEVDRVAAAARQWEAMEETLRSLPAAATQLLQGAEQLEQASSHVSQASTTLAAMPETTQRLGETARLLAQHTDKVTRNEATLGDAALFLAETTERFAAGMTELDTHTVRLQAMSSIEQNRAAATVRETLTALEQQIAAATQLGKVLGAAVPGPG